MAHPNKVRGNRFEYEIRDQLMSAGISVERARGSDGRAIGEHETVDLRVMRKWNIQAKRTKTIAAKYKVNEHQDVVVFRADRAESFALVKFKWLISQWQEFIRLQAEIRKLKAEIKKLSIRA